MTTTIPRCRGVNNISSAFGINNNKTDETTITENFTNGTTNSDSKKAVVVSGLNSLDAANSNSCSTDSEYETIEEEICVTCFMSDRLYYGGLGSTHNEFDSDDENVGNSYDDDDDDDDDGDGNDTDEESGGENGFRIRYFSTSSYLTTSIPLLHPKPKVATPPLSLKQRQGDDDDDDDDDDDKNHVGDAVEEEKKSSSHLQQNEITDSSARQTVDLEIVDCVENFDQIYPDSSSDNVDEAVVDCKSIDVSHQCSEDELNDIITSIGDALELVLDESESSLLGTSTRVCFLGVMKDEIISGTNSSSAAPMKPMAKRPLLHQIYFDGDFSSTSMKKARTITHEDLTVIDLAKYSEGISVVSLFSENDDQVLDQQLGEELGDNCKDYDSIDQCYQNDGTPVPLLTPPGSPLTVEWEGISTTLCEWPSNLIIDNAMQAINELRPMSPTSLENLERNEHGRIIGNSNLVGSELNLTPFCYHNNTNSFISPFLNGVYA